MWTDTRPNGTPIDAGTFCWVTEIEGTNPIYTYGKTQEEVIEKLSRTNASAQAALATRTQQQRQQPSPATPAAPAAPARLSADAVMRHTQELDNPAKAGAAAAALVEDATGLNFDAIALDLYARVAMAWQDAHPEFVRHPANKKLLTIAAFSYVGNRPALVTAAHLTQAYNELLSRGELVTASAPSNEPPNPPSSTSFPGETHGSARTTERPRGTRHATSARSTAFSGARPSSTPTVKYTAEEIRTMPDAKARALIESNDRDYAEACEYHFGQAQA